MTITWWCSGKWFTYLTKGPGFECPEGWSKACYSRLDLYLRVAYFKIGRSMQHNTGLIMRGKRLIRVLKGLLVAAQSKLLLLLFRHSAKS